ncbi:MAG: SpoVA/SpoVAEb family sporulation membrane protein [Thermoflexaceae bacterium]|nr:SpoVA/SpoVAEb family sporulation membrane protein [Thermoflexaceae bacterium]
MKKENELEKDRNKKYNDYVKQVTPTHSCPANCFKAFITGGIICTLGQAIINAFLTMGMDKETAGLWNTLILVLISVILTCLNIYPSIAKWGGAGALVPITGFANGVCAPAMEFKREGWVFGVGARIFSIAGPVILYGIFSSWLLGVIYWAGGLIGIW